MKYLEYNQFNFLTKFDRVLVTGPQRSGTKIVANMICNDTGLRLVRHSKMPATQKGVKKFKSEKNIVLHHPSYVALIEDVQDEKTAIIFVLRNLSDIHASEKKYNWNHHDAELKLLGVSEGDPATIKQNRWKTDLSKRIPNAFSVIYEKLNGHPLWVPKEKRDKFSNINQVTTDGRICSCPKIKRY